MRILFFSSIFPRPDAPNRGIYCFHLCTALASLGHEIRIISPRSWLERKNRRSVAPRPELAAMTIAYPRFFYTPRIFRRAYGSFMWASLGRCLRKAIANWRPDCVLSYWVHPDGEVAVRAAHEAGIPASIIVGGSDVLLLPRQDPARGRHISAALQRADAVITVSNHLRQKVIELGASPPNVHAVYQGVEEDLFSPGDQGRARKTLGISETSPVLLFIGNLVPVKGLDVLLNASALLRKKNIKFHLYLIGEGPQRAALQRLSHQLDLDQQVTFVGSVAQKNLPDWYRAADLTVLASHSEGIPNVLRESIACATPFVATDVGGIHEIADPRLCRLVPPAAPGKLAEAIAAELANPRPRVRGKIFTWLQSTMELVSILESQCPAVAKTATEHSASPHPSEFPVPASV